MTVLARSSNLPVACCPMLGFYVDRYRSLCYTRLPRIEACTTELSWEKLPSKNGKFISLLLTVNNAGLFDINLVCDGILERQTQERPCL